MLLSPTPFSRSAPDADCEVRWAILKFADILIRGTEEAPPKLSIHIPATPITEIAPPLPPVKLPAKARPHKTGTPVGTPVPPSLKLRLPPSTPVVETPTHPPFMAPLMTPATPAPARVTFETPIPIPKKNKVPSVVVKPKVARAVPKALSGGMDIFDVKASRSMLQKLQNHKSAFIFRQPVDPVRDQAPKYTFVRLSCGLR
jgi:transcription initiation factor TFIID subunit 2